MTGQVRYLSLALGFISFLLPGCLSVFNPIPPPAAEAKETLAADPRGVPFLTVRGRMGGSAMAAAAVNALARSGL